MPYAVGYATKRGKCNAGVVKCQNGPVGDPGIILRGELQFGISYEIQDNTVHRWKHWNCMSPMQVKNLQKKFNRDSVTTGLEGYNSLNEEDQATIAAMLPVAESDEVYSAVRGFNVNLRNNGSLHNETHTHAPPSKEKFTHGPASLTELDPQSTVVSEAFYSREWGVDSGGSEPNAVIPWLQESMGEGSNSNQVNNAQSLKVAEAELKAAEADVKVVKLRVRLAKAKIDAIQKRMIAESLGGE
ncbi:hypothetical protein FRB96_003280 [Tulasnella sp. 330]|nr:hypothetical protein FRB96_003280 [Tulasnella sp. 330]